MPDSWASPTTLLLFLRIQRCSNLSHLKIQTKISLDLIRNGHSVFFYLSLHVQILKKMFSRSHFLPSRLVFAALQPAVSPQTPWSCVSLFPGPRHFLSPCPTLPAKPGIAPPCPALLPPPSLSLFSFLLRTFAFHHPLKCWSFCGPCPQTTLSHSVHFAWRFSSIPVFWLSSISWCLSNLDLCPKPQIHIIVSS